MPPIPDAGAFCDGGRYVLPSEGVKTGNAEAVDSSFVRQVTVESCMALFSQKKILCLYYVTTGGARGSKKIKKKIHTMRLPMTFPTEGAMYMFSPMTK